MEIILLKNMDTLGYKHDIVTVKNGYGRNFLIPQGLGVIANGDNRKKLEQLVAEEDAKESARVGDYKEMAAKLDGQTLKIAVKAGTSGKIFGSVTSVQIAQALNEQLGIDVERRRIEMPEDIKEIGKYNATINFHKEVSGNIDFELVQD